MDLALLTLFILGLVVFGALFAFLAGCEKV
jgi:hypothetical protein